MSQNKAGIKIVETEEIKEKYSNDQYKLYKLIWDILLLNRQRDRTCANETNRKELCKI